MGWGSGKNKEIEDKDLPERLRGKTPEQVAQELADAEGYKAELADVKSQNAALSSGFESFKTDMGGKFDQLMNRLPAPTPKTASEPADFITEPDRAFAERAGPLATLSVQTASIVAKQAALEKFRLKQKNVKGNIDGMLFERYIDDIEALAKQIPTAQLVQPETWEHLFYNVKGRRGDEVVASVREGKNEFFIEPTQTSVSSADGVPDKLSTLELRVCDKMKISPEQYLKRKKEMVTGVPDSFVA